MSDRAELHSQYSIHVLESILVQFDSCTMLSISAVIVERIFVQPHLCIVLVLLAVLGLLAVLCLLGGAFTMQSFLVYILFLAFNFIFLLSLYDLN